MTKVYTIGHSTRTIDEFVKLLEENGVKRVIDIRTIPRSRHNPQFEKTNLEVSLPSRSIEYEIMPNLGGLRPKVKVSHNEGWHNQSFRNYADYMQTEEFARAIGELIERAGKETIAIMCAEAVPWRCHRSLVGDALVIRGIEVYDIISEKSIRREKLTSFAKVDGNKVSYPDDETKE